MYLNNEIFNFIHFNKYIKIPLSRTETAPMYGATPYVWS